MNPPQHAPVLSVDEKSQIQAIERTQPGLSLAKSQPATQTHDYTRHGTTTLFAALNVLDGTVLGQCPITEGTFIPSRIAATTLPIQHVRVTGSR